MPIITPDGEVVSIIATVPGVGGGMPVKKALTAEGQIWPPVGQSRIDEYWQPYISNFPELGGQRSDLIFGPWWATSADVVVCGAGGGGAGGDGSIGRDGRGGGAGQWAHGTLTPEPVAHAGLPQYCILGVSIAALGGAGGAKERSGAGGSATRVTGTGVTGAGGAGGSGYGDATGASPGDYTAFGHATFRKYTNACSVLQFLSSFLNRFFTTFGTASIHGYTRSFVKKAKQRHFLQFLFSDKYKWIFVQDKHQHDVHHRCVIGNKHITALFVQCLPVVQLVTESHTVK